MSALPLALRRVLLSLSVVFLALPAAAQEPEPDAEPSIGDPAPEEKPAEPEAQPEEKPEGEEKPAEPEAKPEGDEKPAEPGALVDNNDGDFTDEGEYFDVTGEPPEGDEPAANENQPPQGDKTLDQLMPIDEQMAPVDEDGDGNVEEAERPIEFDVPDNLAGPEYLEMLKQKIEEIRPKLIEKMLHKDQAKQAKAMNLIIIIMLGLTAAGLLFLLAPLFLKKKYPGREKLLWRGAMLGAVTWITTMLVFTGAMFMLRTAKNATAHLTSPKITVTNAAFNAAPHVIDWVNEDASVIFEPPIAQLAAGQQEDVMPAVLENVAQFRNDLDMFQSLSAFFKSLGWLFGSLGTILVILAVVMFMLSQKQVLADIFKLPGRAAAGDAASFGAVVGEMQKRSFREVVALVCTIGFLIVAAVGASALLAASVGPAVAELFDIVIYNVYYILSAKGASRAIVWISLYGVGFFLALVLLFIILANAFFLGKSQKVWQQKWRHQLPVATYKKFWLWGPISWLWIQALPLVFIVLAGLVIGALDPMRGDDINWDLALLAPPLILIIGLPIFMWAAQGFRAMKFLRKFDHLTDSPEAKPAPVAANTSA